MREWLRQAREEKGLTMKQISSQLGITESYYCCIENGTRQKNMDLTLVSALSVALKMPISKIAKLEQEEKNECNSGDQGRSDPTEQPDP